MSKVDKAVRANKKAYQDALKLQKDIKKDGSRARSTMSTGVEPAVAKKAPRRGAMDEAALRDEKSSRSSARPSSTLRQKSYGKRG